MTHRIRTLQVFLISLPLLAVLTGCVISSTMPDYPQKWEPLEAISPATKCPQLGGLYAEWGDAPNGCHSGIEACRSLSYSLLGGNIGYEEFWDESTKPRFPIGTHVELRQPAENRLEIVQWQFDKDQKRIVSKKMLEMEKGDFTCGVDGLMLKSRAVYLLVGLSNLVGSVSRSFKAGEDGCLVMQSKISYIGHHIIFPGAHSFGIWVRWPAFSPDEVTSEE